MYNFVLSKGDSYQHAITEMKRAFITGDNKSTIADETLDQSRGLEIIEQDRSIDYSSQDEIQKFYRLEMPVSPKDYSTGILEKNILPQENE